MFLSTRVINLYSDFVFKKELIHVTIGSSKLLFALVYVLMLDVLVERRRDNSGIRAYLLLGEHLGLQGLAVVRQVHWIDVLTRQKCINC